MLLTLFARKWSHFLCHFIMERSDVPLRLSVETFLCKETLFHLSANNEHICNSNIFLGFFHSVIHLVRDGYDGMGPYRSGTLWSNSENRWKVKAKVHLSHHILNNIKDNMKRWLALTQTKDVQGAVKHLRCR